MSKESEVPLMKTYNGNCHCGAYVFEARLPEITKLSICNCSICSKKAAVWAIPGKDCLTWVKGDVKTMKGYTFANKQFEHKFCGTCGTAMLFTGYFAPLKDGEQREPDVGLNVRCFRHGQIPDIWDMETSEFDGQAQGVPYEPPMYTGPEPSMDVEGGRLYTGSCHCGAVKVAIKSKPLDKTFKEPIFQCNCSGCIRAGGCSVYPHKDQVVIEGEDNIDAYSYGWLKAWEKMFCKTCGVFIGRRSLPVSDELASKLPEQAKKWTVDMNHLQPINLRILNDVDLKELVISPIDGYNLIPPKYIDP